MLVKLVSALRVELNLPRDDDEFMKQLKDMERRAWAAVNKAYGIAPRADARDRRVRLTLKGRVN